jgi:putative colanic acid biosynthesis glycosyltransferase WcaI
MRVLALGINYAPERTSVAPFTTGLCEHLAASGHTVTVVTAFPYYPEWRVWDGYRGSFYRREVIRGVNVHRVAHFIPQKPSRLLERLAYDISFTVHCFLAALFCGDCDVIYCSCPPPTVALAAYFLSFVKSAPYVMKLTDLATDAALATGIMKPGLAIRMGRALETFTCRRARAVICLCQGFIDRLKERGIEEEKLLLISDWGDTDNLGSSGAPTTFRAANNLPERDFLAFHTGNMGKKQKLMNLIDAAGVSQAAQGLGWVVVGQGEDRQHLQSEIASRSLSNIRLLPLQPAESLRDMYASADVLLLNQAAAVEDAVIPSKLLTYMAAGKPIVAAVSEKSEAARQIRRANCGVVVAPENPQALVEAVLSLRSDPSLCREYEVNARLYAETHFTKAGILNRYDNFFQNVCPDLDSLSVASRKAGDD